MVTEGDRTLSPGDRLGPYSITARLGAGGMGVVYAAEDTRLGRTVAIKVLPAHVTASSQARARFEREAKLVSSLNHPHICTLFDVGHQDGLDYLVMEHLEGETLAVRIGRGPLPVDQAIDIGAQIAGALESAHRQGVAHRDLKPQNVMLTKDGAKLLDFGLAKTAVESSAPQLTKAPTVTSPLTEQGTIVGTVGYMSPEQLEGREVDARSDIFALGVVLYEMVTGQRAFKGATQASIIAAILKDDPAPMSARQPVTPPALERLVRTCLAKDPDQRWKSAGDLQRQLEWIRQDLSGTPVAPRSATSPSAARGRRGTLLAVSGWLLSAGLLVAWLIAGGGAGDRLNPAGPMIQAQVEAPFRLTLTELSSTGPAVISPDGRRVAMTTLPGKIWIVDLSTGESRPLRGVDGARFPFWSPDSRSLAFFTAGKLHRIPAVGGVPQEICAVVDGRGGSWNEEGTILFAPNITGPLHVVSDAGGPSRPLKEAGENWSHRFPDFLPDGRHFVFLRGSSGSAKTAGIYLASLDDPTPRLLVDNVRYARYASGHLLYEQEGTLVARPLDLASGRLTGRPIPLVDEVMSYDTMGVAGYSVSRTGTLVYAPMQLRDAGFHRLDPDGENLESIGPATTLWGLDLSPDGRRALVGVAPERWGGEGQLWTLDLASGSLSRLPLPFEKLGSTELAIFSPDGRHLTTYGPNGELVLLDIATGEVRKLIDVAMFVYPAHWSSDGRYLLLMEQDTESKIDTVVLDVQDDNARIPVARSRANEFPAEFSPDGRMVAYVANDPEPEGADVFELFVTEFPGPGRTWQVSTGGVAFRGDNVVSWSPDGTFLYFVADAGRLMRVEVDSTGKRDPGPPREIFHSPTGIDFLKVAPDGRLLLSIPVELSEKPALRLLVNWTAGLAE